MGVTPQIKKILFTTDLSSEASHAFTYALGLAAQYQARLKILYVMEDAPQVHSQDFIDFLGRERWAEVRQAHEQEIRQLLIGKKREAVLIRQALEEMVSAARKDAGAERSEADEIVVTQGDVVGSIVQEIEAGDIDLLVMGYHARGRIEETLTGSVSRSVLRKVTVPVLLVKLP
jgi:nucleotide-binding universal stress UspA family protein